MKTKYRIKVIELHNGSVTYLVEYKDTIIENVKSLPLPLFIISVIIPFFWPLLINVFFEWSDTLEYDTEQEAKDYIDRMIRYHKE